MRVVKLCCVLLLLGLLAGCGKSMETARQLAAPNLYQEVKYENAAQVGPTVAVVPGTISTYSYEFMTRIKPETLREYGELELGKANFRVMERSSLDSIYQEIALAANMGDGSMAATFARHDLTPPQWVVMFNIADVKFETTDFSYADKDSTRFAGALVGSFFGSAALGQGVIGSISNAKETRHWNITMAYRVLDGATGRKLHEGNFTEQATIMRELTGFLGVDSSLAGGLTLSTVTQRLVQKAVQDMDRQHKLPFLAQAATQPEPQAPPPSGKRGKSPKTAQAGKGGKAGSVEQTARLAALQAEQARPQVACSRQRLGGFMCDMPDAWSFSAPPSALEVALTKKPQLKKMIESSQRGKKSDFMDAIIAFEILRTAGPLVTLSEPSSPLARMGKILAVDGSGVEGRVLVLPGAGSEFSPEKLTEAVVGHMRDAVVVEPLAVETVAAGAGQRSIGVYKYIKVDRRREAVEQEYGIDENSMIKDKIISTPHYYNMAMSVIPRGNDLLMVIIIAPESRFLEHLEGVKAVVASAE